MSKDISVSVVHLIWIPYGTSHFENFIKSYLQFAAGYPHELVLLFNGVEYEDNISAYLTLAKEAKLEHQYLVYHGNCQDIKAYIWAAQQLDTTHILFLNSYCRILSLNWLVTYISFVNLESVGAVGSTGSWQSHFSLVFNTYGWTYNSLLSLKENYSKYKLLIKALFLWSIYFKPFPNVHLRTNAMMINRALFCSLHFNNLRNKMDAFRMESGRNGISRQLEKKGLSLLVVGKNGKAYRSNEWPDSDTFFCGTQSNLLIADNQTKKYEIADAKERLRLYLAVWKNF